VPASRTFSCRFGDGSPAGMVIVGFVPAAPVTSGKGPSLAGGLPAVAGFVAAGFAVVLAAVLFVATVLVGLAALLVVVILPDVVDTLSVGDDVDVDAALPQAARAANGAMSAIAASRPSNVD
jgi:hypothetical protein